MLYACILPLHDVTIHTVCCIFLSSTTQHIFLYLSPQCNMVSWAIDKGVMAYVTDHAAVIRQHLKAHSKKARQNGGRRKKQGRHRQKGRGGQSVRYALVVARGPEL